MGNLFDLCKETKDQEEAFENTNGNNFTNLAQIPNENFE
jgi:hypothetical protein